MTPGRQFHKWVRDKDEFGHPVEHSDTEHGRYSIDGNGAGRMKWTVVYPAEDGQRPDYGMTDTKREAREWAEQDLAERRQRKH